MVTTTDSGGTISTTDPLTTNVSYVPGTDVEIQQVIRRSLFFNQPTVLNPLGFPMNWEPAQDIVEPVGHFRVVIGGEDVTYYRGVPCEVTSFSSTEPFGDAAAEIYFPQISWLAAAPVAPWRARTLPVDIFLGTRGLFEGVVVAWEPDEEGKGARMQCLGALYQADLSIHQPPFYVQSRDIGTAIADIMNSVVSRNYAPLTPVATGIMTRQRGAWGPRLTGSVMDMLATAYTPDRKTQWTLAQNPGRVPVLRLKDLTTPHWTVTYGAPGVKAQLRFDWAAYPNTIYGEGTDPSGCHWRHSKYPGWPANPNMDAPFHQWLAVSIQVEPYTYAADGTITGPSAAFSEEWLRVERYENFGEGITRTDGQLSAQQEIGPWVRGEPLWVGTVTLDADPEEGSRLLIRAGDNIRLRTWAEGILHGPSLDWPIGSGSVLLHVSDARHDPGGSSTLQVSFIGEDVTTLAAILKRNRESSDPARRSSPLRRRSRATVDQIAVWDCESGGGVIPATHCDGGWHVIVIPAGQLGQVVRSELTTSPVQRFAAGVFGMPITAADLAALVGDPLAGVKPWSVNADALQDRGILIAWGGPGQAAGYYPGLESDGDPITGRLVDDAQWAYESARPPWLWVAVYAKAAGSISGRLFPGIHEGN